MEPVYIKIFEDYNKLTEYTFNELMTSMSEDSLNYLDEKLLSEKLSDKQISWQKEARDYLSGFSPEQYFSAEKDPEKLMELFEQAAIFCDKDIPNALADVLVSAGDEIHDRLLEIVLDEEYRRDTENVVIAAAALYVLGRTGRDDILMKLMELLMVCTEQDDLLMESITNAIKHYGSNVLETVMDFIEKQNEIDFRTEYLLMILPDLASGKKSDRVYKLLKASFLKMENKILGASALAEYGDGRAVTVLRGYLEKNLQTIDRETFYEIKKSVETLGGSLGDLRLPNFNNKTNYNLLN